MIRTEYKAYCPVEATEEEVLKVAEQIADAIEQEEILKELGWNLDEMLGDLF